MYISCIYYVFIYIYIYIYVYLYVGYSLHQILYCICFDLMYMYLFVDLEPTPNTGGSSANAPEGGAFKFEYPEVKSFPEPTFTWRKASAVMSETQRISVSDVGNLYIANVDRYDLANYKSTVQNTFTGGSFDRGPIGVVITGVCVRILSLKVLHAMI